MGHVQLRFALGRDERLHSHVHARIGLDRQRHELEASHRHHSPRQLNRARSYDFERARRNQIRHSVPRLRPSFLWRSWGERAGRLARAGRVRLVWNSVMDWWPGYLLDAWRALAEPCRTRRRVLGVLLRILVFEHGRHLAWH